MMSKYVPGDDSSSLPSSDETTQESISIEVASVSSKFANTTSMMGKISKSEYNNPKCHSIYKHSFKHITNVFLYLQYIYKIRFTKSIKCEKR